ncbi:hypothetical protein QFC21_004119 [Naganishia friedmannii]|uniref:Uncharacterized protein n=1 Tax=Naganishia friedmannii TaxID=89922 RepID=A0ACC2VJS1_9TREE|nr:hypothetical protein QFC21_004119 [Naganishia friedmannii]
MDALLSASGPLPEKSHKPKPRRALLHQKVNRGSGKDSIDSSLHSILPQTRLPSSLHSHLTDIHPSTNLSKIKDKKLRAKLASEQVSQKRARGERDDVQTYLNNPAVTSYSHAFGDDEDAEAVEDDGEPMDTGIEVDETAGERTWRVSQDEIAGAVGVSARAKKFDLRLETVGDGGYSIDYTRNGRHLAIASSSGHIATFDWQAGKLHSEIQVGESVRDIKFLHNESFYAVAQKKYVFIYDGEGTEIHKMKQHIDVTKMEFLPYHFLLATVGNAGHLKYHDTSTGLMVAEHKTRLGSVQAMAQNRHNAIIHLGHQNGTVTLWSPNLSTPHVKLLAHTGPVQSISIDPSASSCGRYMATSGADGRVKVWDNRNWGKTVREFGVRSAGRHEVDWSGRGLLAVSGKGGVSVYRDLHAPSTKPPSSYLSLPLPGLAPRSIRFCPYEDILGVGHSAGFSSLLVPGSGIAQYDSGEADVYESYGRRREKEVRGVMEKIQPDLITMDTNAFLGRVGDGGAAHRPIHGPNIREVPFYKKTRAERLEVLGKADTDGAGVADDAESADESAGSGVDEAGNPVKLGQGAKRREKIRQEKEKHKMRGKSKSSKRFLRKKRKNVIDPTTVAVKEKLDRERAEQDKQRKVASGEIKVDTGALSRFG